MCVQVTEVNQFTKKGQFYSLEKTVTMADDSSKVTPSLSLGSFVKASDLMATPYIYDRNPMSSCKSHTNRDIEPVSFKLASELLPVTEGTCGSGEPQVEGSLHSKAEKKDYLLSQIHTSTSTAESCSLPVEGFCSAGQLLAHRSSHMTKNCDVMQLDTQPDDKPKQPLVDCVTMTTGSSCEMSNRNKGSSRSNSSMKKTKLAAAASQTKEITSFFVK